MRATLSFETALTARTLDAMLDRDCLKKYVVRYQHLKMDRTGARKSVSIEFDDQHDCERFRRAVQLADRNAGVGRLKPSERKRRGLLGLFEL